jgi:hypothetical protein
MATETIFTPTKIQLRNATIAGRNVYAHVQNIKVYESMCTPYIKADITIVDNAGLIADISESVGGLAGQPVTFAFYDGQNYYERKEQVVFTVDASPSEENKRVQIYNIGTIGVSYVDDRKSFVQKSLRDETAVNGASKIHRTYLNSDRVGLSVISSSRGALAKDTIGGYEVSNLKPFKAIEDILKRASYASASNPTVYYRDANQFVIGSLEDIFRTSFPQTVVQERSTWGASIHDMFERAHYGVIAAGVIVDQEDVNKARSRLHNVAAAAYQNLNIFDAANNSIIQDKKATATSLASYVAASAANKIGGSLNVHQLNSLRNEPSQDPTYKRQQENEFLSKVKDATKYLVKIPIRAGLQCTVGKGIQADLLAPGDGLTRPSKKVGGHMLIADIMHDCYFDKRTAMATSTFRGVVVKDVIG